MRMMMLKAAKRLGHVVAVFALVVATCNVNSACVFIVHQPDIPESAAKLKKYEAD